VLVDTNVVSELMRPRPHAAVLRWAEQQPRFVLSVVTVEEIVFGLEARASKRLADVFEAFVTRRCTLLDVTESVARRAGRLRALRQSMGRPAGQADMLIAATAQEHSLAVATRNVRDFDGCGIRMVEPFAQ
jgi:predicted nucleic acid-binding protein